MKITSSDGFSTSKAANPCDNAAVCWKFDDTTGILAYDSSRRDITGSLVNGTAWTIGRYGNGLSFDSVNDYVQIQNFSTSNSFTISMWAFVREMNRLQYLTEKETNPPHIVEGSITLEADNRIAFAIHNGVNIVTIYSSSSVGLGWVYIVAVRDITTDRLYLYLNGSSAVPVTDTTTTSIANIVTRRFGGGNRNPENRYFNGTIDEVRIYDRAIY